MPLRHDALELFVGDGQPSTEPGGSNPLTEPGVSGPGDARNTSYANTAVWVLQRSRGFIAPVTITWNDGKLETCEAG
jgi:hypothetical protein